MEEAIEHRERLKILEKHIGEYYYMIGNIHNGISDAMEQYHQDKLKLLGIADVVGRSEQLKCQCTKTEKYYDPIGDLERCQKCEKAL
jgi:predicted RNA-binding protein with PUA-like domain